jgi:hypothetical protein
MNAVACCAVLSVMLCYVSCCAMLWCGVQGWALHVWGDVKEAPAWGEGLQPTGFNDGPFWTLKLKPSANHVGVLIYKGDSTKGEEKAAGGCDHVQLHRVTLSGRCRYRLGGGGEGGEHPEGGRTSVSHNPPRLPQLKQLWKAGVVTKPDCVSCFNCGSLWTAGRGAMWGIERVTGLILKPDCICTSTDSCCATVPLPPPQKNPSRVLGSEHVQRQVVWLPPAPPGSRPSPLTPLPLPSLTPSPLLPCSHTPPPPSPPPTHTLRC